jgi:hypothetical protein
MITRGDGSHVNAEDILRGLFSLGRQYVRFPMDLHLIKRELEAVFEKLRAQIRTESGHEVDWLNVDITGRGFEPNEIFAEVDDIIFRSEYALPEYFTESYGRVYCTISTPDGYHDLYKATFWEVLKHHLADTVGETTAITRERIRQLKERAKHSCYRCYKQQRVIEDSILGFVHPGWDGQGYRNTVLTYPCGAGDVHDRIAELNRLLFQEEEEIWKREVERDEFYGQC